MLGQLQENERGCKKGDDLTLGSDVRCEMMMMTRSGVYDDEDEERGCMMMMMMV